MTTERRRVYERVLRIVRYNTCNTVQGPSTSARAVRSIATQADLEADAVDKAIRAAQDHGDLAGFDRDGQQHLALAEEDVVLAVIEAEVSLDDTDQDVIGTCNGILDEIRAEASA